MQGSDLANYKFSVLFVSDSRFNLQAVAEIKAKSLGLGNIDFYSAALKSNEFHPKIKEIIENSGVELALAPSSIYNELTLHIFDLLVFIGETGGIQKFSPPPMLPHFHWEIDDSVLVEAINGQAQQFQNIMDILNKNIETLFNSDFLNTLFIARRHQQLILDNMLDGVMAHNENRKIFFFNKAAEKITAMKREDVLGKDCHEIFPDKFCGGECDYCSGPMTSSDSKNSRKKREFTLPNGKKKILDMLILPMTDEVNNNIGAMVMFKDETELENLRSHLKHHHSLDRLVTKDPKMLSIFEQIKEVASIQAPVLIEGESGTGKELVANAIHNMSNRAGKPFVAVNCGALPEGVLESEMFGHVKGAFTGAFTDKKGRFELAHKGTLFLDEVAELSPAMQVKLLRALQEKCFEKVGGEKLIHVDIRIISATNQDLKKLMKAKQFRRDLYYRLCVVPIGLPPLRERYMDIQVLVEHFLDLVATETDRPVLGYTSEVIDALSAYTWPGNVRELRNAIEYSYVKSRDSVIKPEHLPPEIATYQKKSYKKPGPSRKIDKEAVISALSKTDGNRKDAAKLLGIGRATLYRYLEHYNLR